MKEKDKKGYKLGLYHALDEREKEILNAMNELYANSSLVDILPSSDGSTLKKVQEKALAEKSMPKAMTDDEMAEHCLQVRSFVKQGKANNIEVQFDKGVQMFLGKKHELYDTIIKIRTFDGDTSPTCIFIKAGGTLDARVFIGGENAVAVMATKNEAGEEQFTRLSEFYLFSIQKNPDPNREVGMLTSYVWLTAKIYSGIFLGYTFDPIRSLLLAEWLHLEWQRAKEVSERSTSAKIGDDVNGK